MTVQEIPLTPDNQRFSIALGGKSWHMRLLWRDVAGWVLDLFDADNEPVITGVPLVPGVNLLAQYPYLPFDGVLAVGTVTGAPEYPTQYNLGTAAKFYYVQDSE
ncbi:phage baseplate plug family protein [Enterobacter sp.]|uniref:phage baseplate plug family protein n=1 Tax=Enterobacter sp. TaxID=42895 RepID=UPI003D0B3695